MLSLATQVFRNAVSAALNTGKFTGNLKHPACSSTAHKTMNDISDCLNNRSYTDPYLLKRAMSADQPQVEKFLEACVQWIEEVDGQGLSYTPASYRRSHYDG